MKKISLLVLTVLLGLQVHSQVFTKDTTAIIANDGLWTFGGAWGDYDNDGYLDLFISNIYSDNILYHNNGDGTFTIADTSIIEHAGTYTRCGVWGDYDNDGNLDLFVACGGGNASVNNLLYNNNGDGTFTRIDTGNIVNDAGYSSGATWGDYNNDGYLDVFVTNGNTTSNFLYENNGDGTFTKITTGDVVADAATSATCTWVDYDRDGQLDLYVANWDVNYLYNNNGDGTFTRDTSAGDIITDNQSSTGSSWGDYNNDGYPDLYVANFNYENNNLYQNNGDGTFTRDTSAGEIINDGKRSTGSSWGDYDNDGDLDMMLSNWGSTNHFYTNNGDGTFTKDTVVAMALDQSASHAAVWGDYDLDGDVDLFVANGSNYNNFFYTNDGNLNGWINLKLVGTVSNASAIGAKVSILATINATPRWQYHDVMVETGYDGQNSLNVEFGLGNATVIDSIRIEWPSGIVWDTSNVNAKQFLTINERQTCDDLCVWPGDANADGIANVWDLLPISVAFGDTGAARVNASIDWKGQFADDWTNTLLEWNINNKYVDCNGDGEIEITDVSAVVQNYGLIHSKSSSSDSYSALNPDMYFEIRSGDIVPGSLVEVGIMVGRDTVEALRLFSYAFCINYDPQYIDSGSVNINFSNSFIFRDTNSFTLVQDFYTNGRVEAGLGNKNQINSAGSGEIGTMTFFVTDNVNGIMDSIRWLPIEFCNVQLIDSVGQELTVNTFKDSVVIEVVGIGDQTLPSSKIKIYPNPATHNLNVAFGNLQVEEIRLINAIGQVVYSEKISKPTIHNFDIVEFNNGIYFLELLSQQGIVRKAVILNQ
ncbi:MAG: VCBS repeat-containing protein [Bacteroidia bacterium]|nr:VCBS repeat-containing protein [Bacteroidia bacterium]